MNVDVTTHTDIEAPISIVAAFASDPDNAPRWYVNIKSVSWQTPHPLVIGSRFAFVAQFLGRRLEYVYQVAEYVPGRRLVMHTADGPFPMQTTYEWEPTPHDAAQSRYAIRLFPDRLTIHVGSDAARESQGSGRAESIVGIQVRAARRRARSGESRTSRPPPERRSDQRASNRITRRTQASARVGCLEQRTC